MGSDDGQDLLLGEGPRAGLRAGQDLLAQLVRDGNLPLLEPVANVAHPAHVPDLDLLAEAGPELEVQFTDRLLGARGRAETWFLGADTMRPLIARILAGYEKAGAPGYTLVSFLVLRCLGLVFLAAFVHGGTHNSATNTLDYLSKTTPQLPQLGC